MYLNLLGCRYAILSVLEHAVRYRNNRGLGWGHFMKKSDLKNYEEFRVPRTRTIRALNDVHVVTSLSCRALQDAQQALGAPEITKLSFEVPTVKGESISIAREKSEIMALLSKAADRDLLGQALIVGVALVEDYLVQSLFTILSWYPKKLSSGDRKVDLDVVLGSKCLEDLIGELISKRIHSIFYSSPADYFRSTEDTLSINIPENYKHQYCEVKATRDLLVHNSGIINSQYLAKAGKLVRGAVGETVPLDGDYLQESFRTMKRIVVSVYSELLKKHGNFDPQS